MTVDLRRLGLARLRLLDRRPYYATGLYRLSPRSVPGLGTAAVDRHWNLYLDPDAAAEWTIDHYAAVLEHELGHLLRDHAARADLQGVHEQDGSVQRFNMAADAEINDDLDTSGVRLPGVPVTPSMLGLPDGQLAEWYFHRLPSAPQACDCGSGAHGQARPWDLDQPGDDGVDPVTAQVLRSAVADAVRQHQSRYPGSVPAGLIRWAHAMGRSAVDWRTLLRRLVRRHAATASGQVDYTMSRPSRRSHVMHPVVLPTLRRPTPQVAVVIDTSGSMNEGDLATAVTETTAVLAQSGLAEMWLVSCDTQAQAQRVRASRLRQVALTGGGGTDLEAGLRLALGQWPRPDLVVTITDGFTPWPTDPPGHAVFVVCVVGDGPPAPGWATTVHIPSSGSPETSSDIF